VAIDGDTLAVATPATDVIAESTGSVYVFERGKRGFEFRAKLMAADAAYRDRFGSSVDFDGETIVVGAVGDDNLPPGGDQGAAYIFRRIAGTWTQEAKIVAADRQPLDAFGTSVAIDGGRVVVGASGAASNQGAAYLFEFDGAGWSETAKFTSAWSAVNDRLGAAVALRGSLLVAGAPEHDVPPANAGAIHVALLSSSCPADLDADGGVGASDLSLVLLAWGSLAASDPADLDGDGTVGAADLSILLESWGQCG
jgi:hypothetical protein